MSEVSEYRLIACYLGPSVDQWARMYIEVCVVISFVGNCMKGFKSLFLTIIGMTGAAIIYILWRDYYLRLVEIVGEEIDGVENLGGLMGANYLDIVIAATILVLILIHMRDALLRFRTTYDDAVGRARD